jgi:hypothetical protein
MWDWFSQEGPRRWEIVQRIDVGGECLSRGDGAHVALARRRAARRWGDGLWGHCERHAQVSGTRSADRAHVGLVGEGMRALDCTAFSR